MMSYRLIICRKQTAIINRIMIENLHTPTHSTSMPRSHQHTQCAHTNKHTHALHQHTVCPHSQTVHPHPHTLHPTHQHRLYPIQHSILFIRLLVTMVDKICQESRREGSTTVDLIENMTQERRGGATKYIYITAH